MSPGTHELVINRKILLIFGAALLVYVAFQVSSFQGTLRYFDTGFETEDFYHPAAVNLLESGVYGLGSAPDIEPTTFRPPLYSVVLAGAYGIFGPNEVVGLVLNNILLTGLIIVTFLAGARFGPWIGLVAALVLMLDPIYLAHANRNQSDMLFAFLMTSVLYFGLRSVQRPVSLMNVSLCAAALGLALLTRAAALYLWIPLCIVMLFALWKSSPRLKVFAAVAIIMIVQGTVALSWSERNKSISGNPAYASMVGWHLVSFYAPLFIAKRDGLDAQDVKQTLMNDVVTDPAYQEMTPGEQERFLADYGMQLVKDNWLHALLVIPDNIPKMFLGYPAETVAVHLNEQDFTAWQDLARIRHETSFSADTWDIASRVELIRYYLDNGLISLLAYGIFLKAFLALTLVLATIAIIRMVVVGSPEQRRAALLIFFVFGALAGTALLTTQARFRLPVMPAISIPAAIAFVAFVRWAYFNARERRSGQRPS
jgi:4-amino-4-deoxy-L-arabinose transferase-like glycosyltransferase